MSRLSTPLKGIVPPLVTPLKNNDSLDAEGLENLVEHVLAGGVHGLFILGTTGEAPSLSEKLKRELVEKVCKQVRSRVPVLVGIMNTSFTESIKLAQYSHECGANGVVIAPPYYFTASQPELIEYFGHIASEQPLPVYIYNMPGCTKVSIAPETVLEMSENPKVAGFKDSSYNMVYFHKVRRLLRNRPDFSTFVGPCELMAESVLLGSNGGVNGGANMFPSLYVDLYNAAAARDIDTVLKLQSKVVDICSTVYCVGKYDSSTITGIKCALNQMGICSDFVARPFSGFQEQEKQAIRKILAELKKE
ncbi:MAG TPA: dihydrodipicolinate synthase family protein [Phycisphaerales bacterium]|nr:dihydrodipicolinate synthase family protein [Phycisphaerales bacterium]